MVSIRDFDSLCSGSSPDESTKCGNGGTVRRGGLRIRLLRVRISLPVQKKEQWCMWYAR